MKVRKYKVTVSFTCNDVLFLIDDIIYLQEASQNNIHAIYDENRKHLTNVYKDQRSEIVSYIILN